MADDPIRRLLDSKEDRPNYAEVSFDLNDALERLSKVKGVNPKILSLARTLRTLLARDRLSRSMKGEDETGFKLLRMLKRVSGYGNWTVEKDDELDPDDFTIAQEVAGANIGNVSHYSFSRDFHNRSELSFVDMMVWPGHFFVNMISTDRVSDGHWDFPTMAHLADGIREWISGD